jgi:Ca2+:H+ antiporter
MSMKYVMILLVLVPVAGILHFTGAPAVFTFFTAAISLVPLAALLGLATEAVASRAGATLGGFLNATLGNAVELIVGLAGVRAGINEIVKASITGSILGNSLLELGAAFLVGGFRYSQQRFNRAAAGMGATLMVLAVAALLMPSLFHLTGGTAVEHIAEDRISLFLSVLLIVAYGASLLFSFVTHRHLFPHGDESGINHDTFMPMRRAIIVLIVTTAAVIFVSEILVKSVEVAAETLGWGEIFVGLVVIAVVGNAVEHSSALYFAWRDRMDLAIAVTQGSSAQIALLIAPLICIVSHIWADPLILVFTPLEVAAVGLALMITAIVSLDGEANWFEGVLLLVVYLMMAVVFFFV